MSEEQAEAGYSLFSRVTQHHPGFCLCECVCVHVYRLTTFCLRPSKGYGSKATHRKKVDGQAEVGTIRQRQANISQQCFFTD